MARHTIVIDVPDEMIETNNAWHEPPAIANLPGYVEQSITGAIENDILRVAGRSFRASVVEYHHEQMTTTEENP